MKNKEENIGIEYLKSLTYTDIQEIIISRIRETKELKDEIDGLKEVLEDKRKLTLDIEKVLFGDNGAKNPSMGDVLKSIIQLKDEIVNFCKIVQQVSNDKELFEYSKLLIIKHDKI